eukprot:gene6681-biopygen4484
MSNSDHEPSAEDKHADEPVNEEEGAPAFFSLSTFKVAQVNMINGLLNGYSIGFVGPYSTLFDMSENCNAYYKEEPCVTLANSNCKWRVDQTLTSSASGHTSRRARILQRSLSAIIMATASGATRTRTATTSTDTTR